MKIINCSQFIPKELTEGKRFTSRLERGWERSKAFARLFGIDTTPFSKCSNVYRGFKVDKKSALAIMKKYGISNGWFILHFGKFSIGGFEWYEFKKVINGKVEYQLHWCSDGLPG